MTPHPAASAHPSLFIGLQATKETKGKIMGHSSSPFDPAKTTQTVHRRQDTVYRTAENLFVTTTQPLMHFLNTFFLVFFILYVIGHNIETSLLIYIKSTRFSKFLNTANESAEIYICI